MDRSSSLSRIDWVAQSCRLLAATAAEFQRTQPFAGITIGTGIHLEPKTVALLMTWRAGGARLVCTGNLNSTQPETVSYLRDSRALRTNQPSPSTTSPFLVIRGKASGVTPTV